MTYTPMQRLIAAKKVYTHTSDEVEADWRGYHIHVTRQDGDVEVWYITVTAPNGIHDYDGFWRPGGYMTEEDAVAEAFTGAALIDEKPKITVKLTEDEALHVWKNVDGWMEAGAGGFEEGLRPDEHDALGNLSAQLVRALVKRGVLKGAKKK